MSLALSKKATQVKPSSTLVITAKAKAMKAEGIDIVGFGAGEPDFDTPDNIKDAAKKALDDGFTKYTPASGTVELKEAICKKFKERNNINYEPNQIVISNGGKHSLCNVFQAILNPGDEVIIPAPFWLTYPETVKLCDGTPVYIKTDASTGYKATADQIAAACTENTKALILCTPSNPTGMVYTKEELEAIAKVAIEKDFYVVADEMYEYLVYEGAEHVSIASLGEEIYKRTITCSGLSKSYAMTGWRIGFTGTPVEIAKVMGSVQSHQTSNVNSITQKAALEALNGPQEKVEEMRQNFERRRNLMGDLLADMKYVKFVKPQGAFYYFVDLSDAFGKEYKGKKIESAADAAAILIEDYHVVIVPCADFGAPECFRLSYAISDDDIRKGLGRLSQFLDDLK